MLAPWGSRSGLHASRPASWLRSLSAREHYSHGVSSTMREGSQDYSAQPAPLVVSSLSTYAYFFYYLADARRRETAV